MAFRHISVIKYAIQAGIVPCLIGKDIRRSCFVERHARHFWATFRSHILSCSAPPTNPAHLTHRHHLNEIGAAHLAPLRVDIACAARSYEFSDRSEEIERIV